MPKPPTMIDRSHNTYVMGKEDDARFRDVCEAMGTTKSAVLRQSAHLFIANPALMMQLFFAFGILKGNEDIERWKMMIAQAEKVREFLDANGVPVLDALPLDMSAEE